MNLKIRLLAILYELLGFLETHKVNYASVIKRIVKTLEPIIDHEKLQQAIKDSRRQLLGGMGSLNDVWITKENGHVVDDEKAANRRLEEYREKLRRILVQE